VKKLQMHITFHKELGFRCSKNKSCSKWDNECPSQHLKGVGIPDFPKILSFTIFLSFNIFSYFLYFSVLFRISILVKEI